MNGIILDLGRYWILFMFEALEKAEKDVSLEETCFFSRIWSVARTHFLPFADRAFWRGTVRCIEGTCREHCLVYWGISFSRDAKCRNKIQQTRVGGLVGTHLTGQKIECV